MRAFVLAAGLGTRMRPLTDRVPKCLLPINGHPQLAYWFYLLRAHDVDEVLVNTHHLDEQVREYVQISTLPVKVSLFHEPVLLGSAGTLQANRRFVDDSDPFLVAYGDTLTDADLSALVSRHRSCGKVATIGLFETPTPSACGIVELDTDGTVLSFEEKPRFPKSNLAFAGIAACSHEIFDHIPATRPCDLGTDVFGHMAGKLAGWELGDAYLRDIGTPDSYKSAQQDALHLRIQPV